MLLSRITVDTKRWQKRETPYSARTVEGILADGLDPSRFDPLPLIQTGHNGSARFVVGGDGHSRYEACRRLAKDGKLPAEWKRGRDYDVPHRIVNESQAQVLAWTMNMISQTFTPVEEARVFREMLDAGKTPEQIAKLCNRDARYVTETVQLTTLCRDIKAAVGAEPQAGGIDYRTAVVLAGGFIRYGVDAQRQQELWHRCLKHAMLNFQSARKFIATIGPQMKQTRSKGLLFKLPANAVKVLDDAGKQASAARSASIGVSLLLKAHSRGGLKGVPDLARWVERRGEDVYEQLRRRVTQDADVLAKLLNQH